MSYHVDDLEASIQSILPLVYTDDLSLMELTLKVVAKLNEVIDDTNIYFGQDLTTIVNNILTEWLNEGKISTGMTPEQSQQLADQVTLNNWTIVNDVNGNPSDSRAMKESIYMPNDTNIFGYKNDGTFTSLATTEQNNINKFGDYDCVTWIATKGYASVRGQSMTLQTIDDQGNPTSDPGRTFFHQGNLCNHFMISLSSGTQLMPKNTYNYPSGMDINGQFPANSLNGADFVIPRSGLYLFDFTVRPTSLVNQFSVCRVGHTKGRTGTPSYYNMKDIVMSSSYGSGFYGATYMKEFVAGDVVTPFIYPLTEDITIQAGTKINCYFLGDKPTV